MSRRRTIAEKEGEGDEMDCETEGSFWYEAERKSMLRGRQPGWDAEHAFGRCMHNAGQDWSRSK